MSACCAVKKNSTRLPSIVIHYHQKLFISPKKILLSPLSIRFLYGKKLLMVINNNTR